MTELAPYLPDNELDISTFHALQFILRYTQPGQRVLEIGCGAGELARAMENAGLIVTAIDKDAEASLRAAAEGITVLEEDLFSFAAEASSFDAIVLSRVLHHLHPLSLAIEKLHKLLKEDGVLLVDEFAVEAMSSSGAVWYYGLKNALAACGVQNLSHSEQKAKHLFVDTDDLEIWKRIHLGDHAISLGDFMLEEVQKRFSLRSELILPYLYRNFADRRFRTKDSLVPEIYNWECRLIKEQVVAPIGRQWVFRK